jgi:hypothetical protein
VTVGHAATFLEFLSAVAPHTVLEVASAVAKNDFTALSDTAPVDFSRDVLVNHARRLLVVHDPHSGWADLGNPARVIDTLARHGIEPEWLTNMRAAMRRPAGTGQAS